LSCKLFDQKLKIEKLATAYNRLITDLHKREKVIIDSNTINEIGERVCAAESDLLSTINYNMGFDNPYTIIDDINKKYLKDLPEAFTLSRII
jgi:hypothetical protein